MVGHDLCFVKHRNTNGARVEIHTATQESGYASFGVQSTTAFHVDDVPNGTFHAVHGGVAGSSIDPGPNLFFVKTRATGSGRTELHIVHADRDFGRDDPADVDHYVTDFAADGPAGANGTFHLVPDPADHSADGFGPTLFFLKTRGTRAGCAELLNAHPRGDYRHLPQDGTETCFVVDSGLGPLAPTWP